MAESRFTDSAPTKLLIDPSDAVGMALLRIRDHAVEHQLTADQVLDHYEVGMVAAKQFGNGKYLPGSRDRKTEESALFRADDLGGITA
jgi:hypothetical protein